MCASDAGVLEDGVGLQAEGCIINEDHLPSELYAEDPQLIPIASLLCLILPHKSSFYSKKLKLKELAKLAKCPGHVASDWQIQAASPGGHNSKPQALSPHPNLPSQERT